MKSNDHIRLLGIEGYGYHGVLASEREAGQPFVVDLVLHLDTSKAAETDLLGHTANYAEIAAAVVKVIEGEPANLIETLAARIADTVLEFGIDEVSVTIHKPQAPVEVPFGDVQVSIHRDAPSGVTWEPAGPGLAEISPSKAAAQLLGAEAEPEEPESELTEPAAVEPEESGPAESEESVAAEAELPEIVAPESVLPGVLVGGLAPPVPPVAVPPVAVPPVAAPPVTVPAPDLLSDNEGIPNGRGTEGSKELDVVPADPVDIVLALGGNIGNVRQTLRDAITDLDRTEGINVVEVSGLARTAPVTHADAVAQDDYLNAVVLARTSLSPRGLLAAVHRIEDAHGRVRVERWGDRTLDIDIITYGELISSEPDLTLPHPRAAQRAFVLVPWVQVDPMGVIPGVDGGPVSELVDRAPDRKGVRWLALDWLAEEPVLTKVAPRVEAVAPVDPALQAPVAPAAQAAPEAAPAAPEAEPVLSSEAATAPREARAELPHEPSEGAAQELPSVEEWLAASSQQEQQYADAAPALPVAGLPQPGPALPVAGVGLPETDAAPAPASAEVAASSSAPAQASPAPAAPASAEPEAPGVDWLRDEPDSPPLSAKPQWFKVNPDE